MCAEQTVEIDIFYFSPPCFLKTGWSIAVADFRGGSL